MKVNVDIGAAREWVSAMMNSELAVCDRPGLVVSLQIGGAKGVLNNFVIEPFVAHEQRDEYYMCIYAQRECNTILFYHEGGVDVGDVDAKVSAAPLR